MRVHGEEADEDSDQDNNNNHKDEEGGFGINVGSHQAHQQAQ